MSKKMNKIYTFIKWVFTETCPNCLSAWTGGNPNPEERKWCVVCSHPKTGKMRGWAWRWSWLNRKLVVEPNFKKIERERINNGR